MPATKFSDFSLVWPFANELDQTLFVYLDYNRQNQEQKTSVPEKKERSACIPPNDYSAMFTLATALGHIAIDDSTPSFHLASKKDDEDDEYHNLKRCRHLIYIGGGVKNYIVRKFFDSCGQKEEIERVCNLPSENKRPRVMGIAEKKAEAKYYDKKCKHVKVDYGLMLLTINPFATKDSFKTLLVAGLHSYGTLAAARVASYPYLSTEIVQPIMANFHIPPHLLGTIEAVVQVNVSKDGYLDSSSLKIKHIYVNGLSILPIDSYEGNQLGTEVKLTSPLFSIKREPRSFIIDLNWKNYQKLASSEVATSIRKVQKNFSAKNKEFFNYFSERAVIIISPHSDDSAIACGGLIYYLRNKKLWLDQGRDKRPPVNVLVITKSGHGVKDPYLQKYCTYTGLKNRFKKKVTDLPEIKKNEIKAEIRLNEGCAEGILLDTKFHWLNLNTPKSKEEEDKFEDTMF